MSPKGPPVLPRPADVLEHSIVEAPEWVLRSSRGVLGEGIGFELGSPSRRGAWPLPVQPATPARALRGVSGNTQGGVGPNSVRPLGRA